MVRKNTIALGFNQSIIPLFVSREFYDEHLSHRFRASEYLEVSIVGRYRSPNDVDVLADVDKMIADSTGADYRFASQLRAREVCTQGEASSIKYSSESGLGKSYWM